MIHRLLLSVFLAGNIACAMLLPAYAGDNVHVAAQQTAGNLITLDLQEALKAVCNRVVATHGCGCSPCSKACDAKISLLSTQHAVRTVFIRTWLTRNEWQAFTDSSTAFDRGLVLARNHVSNGATGQSDVSTFTLWKAMADAGVRNNDRKILILSSSLIPLVGAPVDSVVQIRVPSYPSTFTFSLPELLARVDCCNEDVCRQAAILSCQQNRLCVATTKIFPLRHRLRNDVYARLLSDVNSAAADLAAVRLEMKTDVRINFETVVFIDSELATLRSVLTDLDTNSAALQTAYKDNPASLSQFGTSIKDRRDHSVSIASLIAERETCISEILQFCGILQECCSNCRPSHE